MVKNLLNDAINKGASVIVCSKNVNLKKKIILLLKQKI